MVVEDYNSWSGRLADKVLDGLRSIVGIPLKKRSKSQIWGYRPCPCGGRQAIQCGRCHHPSRLCRPGHHRLGEGPFYADVRHELAERKRTEAILRESEERYRTFLESSPDPIVVYDMQGLATYVNPAFEQTFPSREELWASKLILFWRRIGRKPKKPFSACKAVRKLISLRPGGDREAKILDAQLSSTLYTGHRRPRQYRYPARY